MTAWGPEWFVDGKGSVRPDWTERVRVRVRDLSNTNDTAQRQQTIFDLIVVQEDASELSRPSHNSSHHSIMSTSLESTNTNLDNTTINPETAELTAAVDDLLSTLRSKFSVATSGMLAKMDDMSRRLDNLEAVLRVQDDGSQRNEVSKEGS